MKPEDIRVFDAFVKKRGYDDGYSALIADDAFRFALAHRDAHSAVAVNEQMLAALKELMYARTDKAEGMADAAIAAAEQMKGGV